MSALALQQACETGEIELVVQLLRTATPADLDHVHDDLNGETSLMSAAMWGHAVVVTLLVSAGADVHKQNNDGESALMWAAQNGHANVVRILMNAAANVHMRNQNGNTALIEASWNGHVEVAQLLVEGGAKLDDQNNFGATALMAAADIGHANVVQLLLDAGADRSVRNANGSTALVLAAASNHPDTVLLLLRNNSGSPFQDEADRQPEVTCCVCLEDFRGGDGYTCTGTVDNKCDQFTCWACMEDSYAAAGRPDAIQGTLNEDGELLCSNPRCKCPITLARLYSVNASRAIVEAQQELRVQVVRDKGVQRALADYRARAEAERARIAALADPDEQMSARLLLHITEEALTLKCPRCHVAFLDFTGCFALTCHCRAAFCAWCLADCGDDSHVHVLHCPENATNPRGFYGTAHAFNTHHGGRRARRCRELIAAAGLTARARGMLRESLEPLLRELNIAVADVFPG